jgi:hypothetical protein
MWACLSWVIYSPYLSRFSGDLLTTKTLQLPAVCCEDMAVKMQYGIWTTLQNMILVEL